MDEKLQCIDALTIFSSSERILSHVNASMIIVRHPLSRVVSAFQSKLVRLGFTSWDKTRRKIIAKFRENGTELLQTEDRLYGQMEFDDPTQDPRVPK